MPAYQDIPYSNSFAPVKRPKQLAQPGGFVPGRLQSMMNNLAFGRSFRAGAKTLNRRPATHPAAGQTIESLLGTATDFLGQLGQAGTPGTRPATAATGALPTGPVTGGATGFLERMGAAGSPATRPAAAATGALPLGGAARGAVDFLERMGSAGTPGMQPRMPAPRQSSQSAGPRAPTVPAPGLVAPPVTLNMVTTTTRGNPWEINPSTGMFYSLSPGDDAAEVNRRRMEAVRSLASAQSATASSPARKPSLTDLLLGADDPNRVLATAALHGSPAGLDSNQAWMAIQNPDLVRLTPGERALPGRGSLDLRTAGYPQFPNLAAEARVPPQNAWQPTLNIAENPALAQQAAERRAREEANALMAEVMRAGAGPSFGTRGGTKPRKVFQRTGDDSDFEEYVRRKRAAREAAARGDLEAYKALDPGAWQGWSSPGERAITPEGSRAAGPGRSTWDWLSPEQQAAIQARHDARRPQYLDPQLRQALVTARAQGRRITPTQATIEQLLMGGGELSPSQSAFAFGAPYLESEAQKAMMGMQTEAEREIARMKEDTARQRDQLQFDPLRMLWAGLQAALANLPEAATPDTIQTLLEGFGSGAGAGAPAIESGPFAGLTPQQVRRLEGLAGDPVALRNHLLTLPISPAQADQIMQTMTGEATASVDSPEGETLPGLNAAFEVMGFDNPWQALNPFGWMRSKAFADRLRSRRRPLRRLPSAGTASRETPSEPESDSVWGRLLGSIGRSGTPGMMPGFDVAGG